ncbi:MAG TPA: hypothetical protein VN634_08240 [Candidatus Limnocylindrales bacterium]|nr:hypothetical protein [Candidatus Limnocylindrales bacterium]
MSNEGRKDVATMIRCNHRFARPLLLGAWLLMTPPVPLGTELPPISRWTQASSHETSADCEKSREQMRSSARFIVTSVPNASALAIAAALGRLQARCIENAPAAAKP